MIPLRHTVVGSLLAAAWLVGAVPAAAQVVPPGNMWSHGTTLSLFGGAASGDSETGALAGGGVGWEISPVLGLEGRVSWLDRGAGADGFAASLTVAGTWANATAIKPFVEAGVGLYRASFDPARGGIPEFYRRRMQPSGLAGALEPDTFTDPSFVVGGGANVFLSRHVAIRPAADVTFVRRESHGTTVAAARVHVVYHFEDHPVTPR